MVNVIQYVYPSITVTYSGQVFTIRQNGCVYNSSGSRVYSNVSSVKMVSENYRAVAVLTENGAVYTGNESSLSQVASMPTRDIVWVSAGGNNATFLAVTKNGELYGWGGNAYGQLGIGSTASVAIPGKITMPGEEKVFMTSMGSRASAVLTMDGSVYVAGADYYYSSTSSKNSYTWQKLNVTGITYIAFVYGDSTSKLGLYMIDREGNVYCVGSTSYKGPTPSRIASVNAWYVVPSNSTSGYTGVVTHDGYVYLAMGSTLNRVTMSGSFDSVAIPRTGTSFYIGNKGNVYYGSYSSMSRNSTMSSSFRGPVTQSVDVSIDPVRGYYTNSQKLRFSYKIEFIGDLNDPLHVTYTSYWGENGSYDTVYHTGEMTLDATGNVIQAQEDMATRELISLKDYLDIIIGSVTLPKTNTVTHNATNGYKYLIWTEYKRKSSSLTEYEANVVTKYCLSTESEGIVYSDTILKIDHENYNNYAGEFTERTIAQHVECVEYLDTRIEKIGEILPVLKEYVSKSGKRFFLRTVFEKGETTDTYCQITYRVEYGSTDQYGKVYGEKKYEVVAGNYQTYKIDLNTFATIEMEECCKGFGIWDVRVPDAEEIRYTNRGGLQYKIVIQYMQSTTTDESNSIVYTVSYSGDDTAYTRYCTKTLKIDKDNYMLAEEELADMVEADVNALKARIDIPSVRVPDAIVEDYEVYGFTYRLTVLYARGSNINVITTTSYIDGEEFGGSTTSTFLKTESSALSELKTIANGRLNAMKTACNNSPNHIEEVYTVGSCSYKISTEYSKVADNKTVTIRMKLDDRRYYEDTVKLSVKTLNQDLITCQTKSYEETNRVKSILAKTPKDSTEVYSVEGVNFVLYVGYSKEAGSNVVQYHTTCDNVTHTSGECTINETAMEDSIATLKTLSTTALTSLKNELLTKCPKTSTEIINVNGFTFSLGMIYSKSANSNRGASGVTIDGEICSSMTRMISYNTLDADLAELEANCLSIKAEVLGRLNGSPGDRDTVYTVNGFSYRIQTLFNKDINDSLISITTTMDGELYKMETIKTSPLTILDDIDECHIIASNMEESLMKILDKSPKDTDTETYTIDGFVYICGAVFHKEAMEKTITVSIMMDGEVNDSYKWEIDATDTLTDMDNLLTDVGRRLAALKATFYGIHKKVLPWTVKAFEFNIVTVYTKDIESHTISIENYIDDKEFLTRETLPFSLNTREEVIAHGEARSKQIQNLLNTAPDNLREPYTVGNMKFNLGIVYQKNAGSINVMITKMVDGVAVEKPTAIPFNPNDIASLQTKGIEQMLSLKNTLSNVPMNYSYTYRVGEMEFSIGSQFVKMAGDPTVTVITTLDSLQYEDSANITFNYIDIPAITNLAVSRENRVKTILDKLPVSDSEVYSVRHCLYRIGRSYRKNPNEKTIYVAVKLDGSDYGDAETVDFDINSLSEVSDSINQQVEELKRKLEKETPRDLSVTKTISGFEFMIKAHFLKEPDTEVIKVQYDVDSADL